MEECWRQWAVVCLDSPGQCDANGMAGDGLYRSESSITSALSGVVAMYAQQTRHMT